MSHTPVASCFLTPSAIGVIVCPPHLTAESALDFRHALARATREHPDGVIVDMSDTHVIDGTGLRVLLSANACAADAGVALALARPTPIVSALLDAVRETDMPVAYPRVDTACLDLHAQRRA